jgi:hypothetical protein
MPNTSVSRSLTRGLRAVLLTSGCCSESGKKRLWVVRIDVVLKSQAMLTTSSGWVTTTEPIVATTQ